MNICKKCNAEFQPTVGLKNYCSLQCRNSREFSIDSRLKKSLANKGKVSSLESIKKAQATCMERYGVSNFNKLKKLPNELKSRTCKICASEFKVKDRSLKKTCSRACRIIASTNRTYRNGSRKTIYYNGIVLESSWELDIALLLDANRINWIRPLPIKWLDEHNKVRLYYPDFYLVDYDLYLDPKNPYCMEKDKIKMDYISKIVNIVYGPVDDIKTYIVSIV